MDDESATSGASGVSEVESAGKDMTMALLAAMFFIVVATVVVIGLLMTVPGGDDDETVATKQGSGGGAPKGPSQGANATSGGATDTTGASTAARPAGPTRKKPMRFRRSLLCIASRSTPADTRFPPDGLCNVVSIFVKMESNVIVPFDANENYLPNFYAAAQRSARTGYGIHVGTYEVENVVAQLQTDEGAKAMEELWNKKVRHYSLLGYGAAEADRVIPLLKRFRELQQRFKAQATQTPAFVFFGVSPVDIKYTKDNIQKIVTASPPDAVVFQVTNIYVFINLSLVTPVTPDIPNLWKDDARLWTHTLEKGINYRKALPPLQGFPPFLTMGVGVLVNLPVENRKYDDNDGLGSKRDKAYTTYRHWACNLLPTNVVHDDAYYMIKTVVRKELNALGVFDIKETLRKKMCLAMVEGGYNGSWAVADTQFADWNNTCGDGNFAALKWIKRAMNTKFTSC